MPPTGSGNMREAPNLMLRGDQGTRVSQHGALMCEQAGAGRAAAFAPWGPSVRSSEHEPMGLQLPRLAAQDSLLLLLRLFEMPVLRQRRP